MHFDCRLFRFPVQSVLAAELAVFVFFDPVRGIFFVFHGIVVSLLAFRTSERNPYSHFLSAPPYRCALFKNFGLPSAGGSPAKTPNKKEPRLQR